MSRGEGAFLALAAVFYAAGFFLGVPPDWTRSPLFLPTGLLSLALINVRLRSKVLGWGLFAGAFLLFMAVFGPYALGLRADRGLDVLRFMRAMAMYLALAMAGLFQLRTRRPLPPAGPVEG